MNVNMLDALDMVLLSERIRSRGYSPRRVWKLYKELKGDHGVNSEGRVRKRTCPAGWDEHERTVRERAARPSRYGYCADCGTALSTGYLCGYCGLDNGILKGIKVGGK
jgi:hypothetical protein